MLKSKFVGGVLLIVGTSIGGGMLALPVVTSGMGFVFSTIFLIICWLVMTSGALLILEVNLRLPVGSNMVSMARKTLGIPGQVIAWITYLFLLYTLLSAYISGGTDVVDALLAPYVSLPSWFISILFTMILGAVIYGGIRSVDYLNRGLMFGKLGVYILLIAVISPKVQLSFLNGGAANAITGSLMILIASFGFASIVPSLRDYFENDIVTLRRLIVYGSMIPLFCYILWNAVIMGVISRDGQNGLLSLMNNEHATSGLTNSLSLVVNSQLISGFFGFFTSICMVTAFLGVSIGLFDFLADGLSLGKKGMQGKGVLILTFVPPLSVVLICPGIYLKAFNYAGVCCIILLLLLPCMMTWSARKQDSAALQILPGGTWMLGCLSLIALFLLKLAISPVII